MSEESVSSQGGPAPTTSVTGFNSVAAKALVTAGRFVFGLVAVVGLTRLILPWRWALGLWALVAGGVLAGAVAVPVRTRELESHPDPAAGFEAALGRWRAVEARDETGVHEKCHSRAHLHEAATPTCVVLFQGISNCPHQYSALAPALHERGHNVIVPRMPWNGLADLATNALRRLTAEELRDYADEALDIASGLGERVVVLGVSAGGVVAEWAGQAREVDRVVSVSPSFGLAAFGAAGNWYVMRLMLLLPSISIWKDPIRRSRGVGLGHNYLRQSTRGFAEIMRLGVASMRAARERGIMGGSLAQVTSANDVSVDLGAAKSVAESWRAAGKPVVTYEFPKESGLGHDMIDPADPASDPDVVDPILIDLIERGSLDDSLGPADRA